MKLVFLAALFLNSLAFADVRNDIYRTAQAVENTVLNSRASDRNLDEAYSLLARAYDLINNNDGPVECARLYDDANYRGRMLSLNSGDEIYNLSGYDWNDITTSIFVFRGCELEAWEHKNMGGRYDVYRREVAQLPYEVDNFYTAVRCNCR
jgi:hypothetical protein